MRLVKPYAVILITISLGFAQVKLAQESKGSKTASRRSLEQDMDKTVSPCMSFYPYACGKWVKDNPIPPDQSRRRMDRNSCKGSRFCPCPVRDCAGKQSLSLCFLARASPARSPGKS